MKPSEAYDIMQNPDDYSKAMVAKANKVLEAYSEITERDRTGPSLIISIEQKEKKKKKSKPSKSKKAEMMKGGMANGKMHMYAAGGSVTENPGLKALKASGPKGMEAYKKITGRNA
jgi:hypothetical protein